MAQTLRLKYSKGLGGWVIYRGWDFIDGAFLDRAYAEARFRMHQARDNA